MHIRVVPKQVWGETRWWAGSAPERVWNFWGVTHKPLHVGNFAGRLGFVICPRGLD